MARPAHRMLLILCVLALAACAGVPGKRPTPTPSRPPASTPATPPATTPARPVTPAKALPVRPAVRADGITVLRPRDYDSGRGRVRQVLRQTPGEALAAAEAGYYMDVLQGRLRQAGATTIGVARRGNRIVVHLPAQMLSVGDEPAVRAALEPDLRSVAKVLQEYRKTLVAVEGHSANVGVEAGNRQWSEQRALAVARFLVASGLSGKRLVVVGLGPSRPLAANDTPGGQERNRRIELWIEPVVRP